MTYYGTAHAGHDGIALTQIIHFQNHGRPQDTKRRVDLIVVIHVLSRIVLAAQASEELGVRVLDIEQ